MDIRSLLKKTVSHTKSLFTFHTRKISFTHKFARYNFFNKRIQVEHLLKVVQINFVAGVKKFHSQISLFVKNISSKFLALVARVGLEVKKVFITSWQQSTSAGSRLKIACIVWSKKTSAVIAGAFQRGFSGSVAMVKQTGTQISGIVCKFNAGVKKAFTQTALVIKNISSNFWVLVARVGLGVKKVFVTSWQQSASAGSRLKITCIAWSKKTRVIITGAFQRGFSGSVAMVKQTGAQISGIVCKFNAGVKKAFTQTALVIKNISSNFWVLVARVGLEVKKVFITSWQQSASAGSRLKIACIAWSKKTSSVITGAFQRGFSGSVAMVKQTGAQISGIVCKFNAGVKKAFTQTALFVKNISSNFWVLVARVGLEVKKVFITSWQQSASAGSRLKIACIAWSKKTSSVITGAFQRGFSGSVVMVKQTGAQISGIVCKFNAGVKKAFTQTALFVKNINSNFWVLVARVGLGVKKVFVTAWQQSKAVAIFGVFGVARAGKFIFVQTVSFVFSFMRAFNFSLIKNKHSFLIAFSGFAIILGFGALFYFKKSNTDRLEDFSVIKALELRLTQTEAQLRSAQNQLEVMGSLRQEVKSTALKLEETEAALSCRLNKTEGALKDTHKVISDLEVQVKHTASNLEETENSFAEHLAQTEGDLKEVRYAVGNLEHQVKRTASNLEETEASLKKRLVQAESKVETIDSLGESLKLTGLVSLISKNKQKSLNKIKSLDKQNNELDRVKEKIRKEVKRQMKMLE